MYIVHVKSYFDWCFIHISNLKQLKSYHFFLIFGEKLSGKTNE